MMRIDPNKSKAYAGGVGGAGTFLAGSTVVEYLTTIMAWLLGNAPAEVAQAIAFLLVAVGSALAGYAITYYAPPNRISAAMYTEGIKAQELKD